MYFKIKLAHFFWSGYIKPSQYPKKPYRTIAEPLQVLHHSMSEYFIENEIDLLFGDFECVCLTMPHETIMEPHKALLNHHGTSQCLMKPSWNLKNPHSHYGTTKSLQNASQNLSGTNLESVQNHCITSKTIVEQSWNLQCLQEPS